MKWRPLSIRSREMPGARVAYARLRAMTPDEWSSALAGDPALAAALLEAAACYGVVEAQTSFGQMLLDGRGVPRNAAAAVAWFETAAGAGHAPAQNMLGRCCERGWGVASDMPRAALHYRLAAEAGLDWGQYNLANMLLRGRGVGRDRRLALDWFRRAAAQGHAKSMNLVGRFLEEGWELPRDVVGAAFWYRRAAEAGDFRAQYNLASLLAGAGDLAAARRWLRRAIELAPPDFLALMEARLRFSDEAELRAIGAEAAGRSAALLGIRPMPA